MRYRFVTCDVFTTKRFSGNQLAVLPDATGLDAVAMQSLAAEFGYSETTFVLPPADPRISPRCGSSPPGPRCRSPATRRSARP